MMWLWAGAAGSPRRARRARRFKFHHVDTKPLEQIVERWLKPEGE
jgi:hypothetical protein